MSSRRFAFNVNDAIKEAWALLWADNLIELVRDFLVIAACVQYLHSTGVL